MRSLRSVLVPGAVMLGALLGLAFAATYTVSADHSESNTGHPLATTLDQGLYFQVAGQFGCHWLPAAGPPRTVATDGNGTPYVHCHWWADETAIDHFAALDRAGVVTLITGHRTIFAAPEGGHIPGVFIAGAENAGDQRAAIAQRCASTPLSLINLPLWQAGNIWCQTIIGHGLTPSFHTE